MNPVDVQVWTQARVFARMREIETEAPEIKEVYESEKNHGDLCWQSEVGWSSLASEYDMLRWMSETEWCDGKPR